MQERLSEITLILIGSTAIILMLTGLIVISLFIDQKRKYRYRQEKWQMKNNFDQELLRSQLEIQAQSFESISRELHDNVGTLISIAMVHIKSLGFNSETDRQKMVETDGLLDEAMNTLRDISRSLNPENISRLGWQKSFIDELEKIRKTNLFSVHYSEQGDPFLIELSKQVIIFRILQETLNNIVKHSGGTNIDAQVIFSKPELTVSITDDGRGFDPVNITGRPDGLGLKNMLARAAMLPAKLSIKSNHGKGACVILSYIESFN